MRTAIAIMAGLALLAACGCHKGMSGGGAASGTGFTINVPTFTQDLRQGEVKTITIKLNRGEHFKQDVQLTIYPPQGINIDPTSVLVRASDPASVSVRIMVPQDAAAGNYEVRVTGQPQEGAPASSRFTVKVVAPKGGMAPTAAPAR
jgi:uncharacterized membrane protein